jgi:hypothetical protein|uniref:Proline-rich protein PRCC n=1 Tax=Panagrolaimus sp. PS1159 TaxID=55785 RepID=A0AC35GR69_9BILA
MLGLGAYGSDSDNSDTEATPPLPPKKSIITSTKLPEKPKALFPKLNDDEESGPRLNLPTASTYSYTSNNDNKEVEGESTTIQRRDWEIKLAEKEKKKLQKNKKKIAAFGGLSSKVFDKEAEDDEVIQKPINRPIFASQSKSALLSSLPPPKAIPSSQPQTSALSFMPSTIKVKPVSKPTPASSHISKPAKPDSDEEEDSSNFNDFLGLNSVQKKDLFNIRTVPKPELNISSLFLVDEPIGPARPAPIVMEDSSSSCISQQPPTKLKRIDDDAAKKLVYKHEVEQWGASNIFANDAVSGMVDVSVDKQIGPNVHQTLLKNIDHRSLASYAAGKELRQPGKKGPTEKLAKMKHQITHLASIAVARDDELKEQWAASRESKQASKRKYGF